MSNAFTAPDTCAQAAPGRRAQPGVGVAGLYARLSALRLELDQRSQRHRLIIERFRRDIRPLEIRLATGVTELSRTLIEHYRSRALDEASQILLGLWVEENLKTLEEHPFIDADPVAALCALWRQVLGETDSVTDRQLSLMRAGSENDTHARQSMPGSATQGAGHAWQQDHSRDAQTGDPAAGDPAADIINLLFRRLARQLHPDRETDASLKAHKDALMKTCLQARQDKDLGALIVLCEAHLGSIDTVLGPLQDNAVTTGLQKEITKLEARLLRLQQGDPFNTMIFNRYDDASEAAVAGRFEAHKQSLLNEIAIGKASLDATCTAEGLAGLLEQRRSLAFDRLTIAELTGLG